MRSQFFVVDRGQNEDKNTVFHKSGSAPSSPVKGQYYYDTGLDQVFVCTNAIGPVWAPLGQTYSAGNGLQVSSNTFSVKADNSGPGSNDGLVISSSGLRVDETKVPYLVQANTFTASGNIFDNGLNVANAPLDLNGGSPGSNVLTMTDGSGVAIWAWSGSNDRVTLDAKLAIDDPIVSGDAATKNYVDTVSQGLDTKPSVKYATTSANSFTISSGNVTQISGTSIDGQSPSVNDRILIKDAPASTGSGSANSSQPGNGIYVVTGNTTNLTVARASDSDAAGELSGGTYVWVEAGSTNGDSGWVITTDGSITPGTTANAWTQFTGAAMITAGAGLTKSGNTIDVGAGTGITVNANDIAINNSIVPLLDSANTFTNIQTINGYPYSTDALNLISSTSKKWINLIDDGAVTHGYIQANGSSGVKINASNGALNLSASAGNIVFANTGGYIYASGNSIQSVADPTNAQDVATLNWTKSNFAKVKEFNVGDNSSTSFALSHSLTNRDVQVEVYRNGTPWDTIDVEVTRNSTSQVTITFTGITPTTNQFRAVVLGRDLT